MLASCLPYGSFAGNATTALFKSFDDLCPNAVLDFVACSDSSMDGDASAGRCDQ